MLLHPAMGLSILEILWKFYVYLGTALYSLTSVETKFHDTF